VLREQLLQTAIQQGATDNVVMPGRSAAVSVSAGVWAHKDDTEHSAAGPLGCLPCAQHRRAAIGGAS
jgi:hypothetical protein